MIGGWSGGKTGGQGGGDAARAPGEAGKAEQLSGWPWDGQPDYAACNFALGHLFYNLPARLTVDGRVHSETCLTAIGAIAGFAAQRALFARMAETKDPALTVQMKVVKTTAGDIFFVGEPLNRMLVPQQPGERGLWPLAAGEAVAAGVPMNELPPLGDMFAHVAATVGSDREGLPSVPAEHHPHMRTKDLLKAVWPLALMCFSGRLPGAKREFGIASVKFWPAIAAHVAQSLMRKALPGLDPRIALTLVMESAIYASKLDPAVIQPKAG